MLAYQFKKEQSEHTIMAIRTAEDEVTYDAKNINLTFHDFYCKLYTSEKTHRGRTPLFPMGNLAT